MKEFLCRLKNKEKISGTSHKTYKLRGIISTVLLRIRKSLPSVNSYHFQVICLILNVGLLSDILVHPYKLLSDSQRSHFLSHPFLCVAILLSYPTCQTPPPPPSLSLVTFSFKISWPLSPFRQTVFFPLYSQLYVYLMIPVIWLDYNLYQKACHPLKGGNHCSLYLWCLVLCLIDYSGLFSIYWLNEYLVSDYILS